MLPEGEGKNSKPEIIAPTESEESPDTARPAVYADIVAQFNKYTDRPDLFLEAVEKADPGFIKRMNAEAERFSRKNRDANFKFGRTQAYVAMVISAIAAIGLIGAVFYLISTMQANFWTFVGIALLYAVTQGGSSGFASLIASLKDGLRHVMSTKSKDDN